MNFPHFTHFYAIFYHLPKIIFQLFLINFFTYFYRVEKAYFKLKTLISVSNSLINGFSILFPFVSAMDSLEQFLQQMETELDDYKLLYDNASLLVRKAVAHEALGSDAQLAQLTHAVSLDPAFAFPAWYARALAYVQKAYESEDMAKAVEFERSAIQDLDMARNSIQVVVCYASWNIQQRENLAIPNLTRSEPHKIIKLSQNWLLRLFFYCR